MGENERGEEATAAMLLGRQTQSQVLSASTEEIPSQTHMELAEWHVPIRKIWVRISRFFP